jgi:DNA topoisomerase VI B subunit
MPSDDEGRITQGTIAQFMRKRTQLVGFEFGYWKHVQYAAEFLDNALDAIETFQWNELKKGDSRIKFSLDQDLSLENLSILQEAKEDEKIEPLNDEGKLALMEEVGLKTSKHTIKEEDKPKEKLDESGEIVDKSELEVEEEVKLIIDDMNEIIKPVENIIDIEPIVIIRLREFEAPTLLTTDLSQKNVMSYTFEIFDNGIGMGKGDLRKYGKYLASSKSVELKQTRGSQGFGAPSAFSDAQNTTGKPIVAVSKSADSIYATVSEFFTTSKNEKRYLVHPSEVDCPFLHGTYIKLNYLNVKYVRGYVENYIKETALMNPHFTIIFIDPYGEEWIYRRLVSSFPREPKYAKPHPASTNIGDLQDLLTKSNNLTVSAFLKDNFVRISSKTAKQIIKIAERDLQDKLNLLILKNGYISKIQKKSDPIYFLNYEKRVYGRSDKARDKLIIYELQSEEIKMNYSQLISQYKQFDEDLEKINKEIKRYNGLIEKADTKKDMKKIENNINKLLKESDKIIRKKEKIKIDLDNLIQTQKEGLIEIKKLKNRSELEDTIDEIKISKTRPIELTNEQFNSLFHAFKSIKYMAPPTDTAIPVGDSVLENTLVKEIGLNVSENLDEFDEPVESIKKLSFEIEQHKKRTTLKQDPSLKESDLKNISVDEEELINLNKRIFATADLKDHYLNPEEFNIIFEENINFTKEISQDSYQEIFEFFAETYTRDDDFVSGETRPPTSGKGLAYIVEAALAYCNDSKKLDTPKRSRDVLSRFVNRTPKLRDSADCAITKAVQSVNWKNYKLDTYDNNLPKGPIKLLVNVSGPYVHLMFKSQSKNALADDEELIKEIKYCLEAIGRRLRTYLNRKATIHKRQKRASLIEQYIPTFVESIYNIISQGESKYKEKISKEELESLMKAAIGRKAPPSPPEKIKLEKPEIITAGEEVEIQNIVEIKTQDVAKPKTSIIKSKKPEIELLSPKTLKNWTISELRDYCAGQNIKIPSKISKSEIIKTIQTSFDKKREIEKTLPPKPVKIKEEKAKVVPKPKPIAPTLTQTTLPIITTEKIMGALSNDWQNITHLIFKLKIKDMMDARYLQNKLKDLVRKEKILVDIRKGKKHWKLK